ncbi:hypothetical protein AB0E75_14735 [Streptomyces griseoviridis]|uniref:Regulatory protein n=2 Tax=Streptomyces TaxID=1883 RepID=A0A918LFJ0_STRGD|nr:MULTISPECIES: hypothetical protein [Streptomyces]GGS39897.1 hypothetical protein GCM10010238_31690 [Streptomyces niveoruber]GGU23971.1 hypothetical protein GCM10010259_12870 [Streptomyces daghestanicus]GHI29892.1 hypothetical protein Sdagh_16220 [Streptomyces daghestanicus]
MSETTTTATELATQYAAQVTGDLERNAQEQERLSAEIASLQERLAALQRDHSVLVNIRQALGSTQAPAGDTAADTAAVPAPRKKPAPATAGKRTRAAKAAPRRRGTETAEKAKDTGSTASAEKAAKAGKPGKAAKKAPAAGKAAAGPAAKKAAGPTLGELIRGVLAEQKEPRSAAEVAAALGEAHADRPVKTTVVRNTLENLVARNQVQRTKQGTSVFYTVSEAAQAAAATDEAPSEKAEQRSA